MKPKALLSYRHDLPPEIAGRDALIAAIEAKQKLELVYDKLVTEVGDSVTAFMEELIAARCVFLFISEDYFKSAYTLFELIAINEHEEVGRKTILPVCLTEHILDVRDYTIIKAHWDNNPEIRDVLATLLRRSGRVGNEQPDSDAMWTRINKAWEDVVFGYLNTLRCNAAVYDLNALIDGVVNTAVSSSLQQIDRIKADHRTMIVEQISYILEDHPKIRHNLARSSSELRRLNDLSDLEFAKCFLSETGEATRSIGSLTNAAGKLKESVGGNNEEWVNLFRGIQQFCGYLLVNSIDPVWWFNHELELRRQTLHCVTTSGYKLDDPAFVEVVISKELLSRNELNSPSFVHDPNGTGKVVPGRGIAHKDYNNMLMFDAVSVDAVAYTLLAGIHQDLHRKPNVPDNVDDLIRMIKERAVAYKNERSQRPVYYIVSHDYLCQLKAQEWFPGFEETLKGNLQFICCDQDTLSGAGSAAVESQTQLLSSVGHLLNLR